MRHRSQERTIALQSGIGGRGHPERPACVSSPLCNRKRRRPRRPVRAQPRSSSRRVDSASLSSVFSLPSSTLRGAVGVYEPSYDRQPSVARDVSVRMRSRLAPVPFAAAVASAKAAAAARAAWTQETLPSSTLTRRSNAVSASRHQRTTARPRTRPSSVSIARVPSLGCSGCWVVVVPAAAWRRTPPRATRACERCAGTVDRLRCDNSASVYPGAAGASP